MPSPNLTPRQSHTANKLNDGRVLVTGGSGSATTLTEAWLFDPTTDGWTQANDMPSGHRNHAAVVLPDGRVWVGGGLPTTGFGASTAATAVFDPGTGSWTASGDLQSARSYLRAVLLSVGPDAGKVLVISGEDGSTRHTTLEICDPDASCTLLTPELSVVRIIPAVATLDDGRVLIAGGWSVGGSSGSAVASAEIYDPTTGMLTATTNDMSAARREQVPVKLANGNVLIVGGAPNSTAVDIFDPGTNTFTATGSLQEGRRAHGCERLPDDSVLCIAGVDSGYRSSAERWTSTSGIFASAPSIPSELGFVETTLLDDGRVLITGGQNNLGFTAGTSLLYTPQ